MDFSDFSVLNPQVQCQVWFGKWILMVGWEMDFNGFKLVCLLQMNEWIGVGKLKIACTPWIGVASVWIPAHYCRFMHNECVTEFKIRCASPTGYSQHATVVDLDS